MASTPEGAVKKMVRTCLNSFEGCYYSMPVPGGFGKSDLDFVCSYKGFYFQIETKAPGNWLTPLQRNTARLVYLSGATVFIISTREGVDALYRYLRRLERIKIMHPVEINWRD